jgi:hypothetical protein
MGWRVVRKPTIEFLAYFLEGWARASIEKLETEFSLPFWPVVLPYKVIEKCGGHTSF